MTLTLVLSATPTLRQAELREAERSLLDGALPLLDGGLGARTDSARSVEAEPSMVETPPPHQARRQQLREAWEAAHARLHYHLLMLEEMKMQQARARAGLAGVAGVAASRGDPMHAARAWAPMPLYLVGYPG